MLLCQVDGKVEDVFGRKTEGRTLQFATGFSAVLRRDIGHVKQKKQAKRDAYETPEIFHVPDHKSDGSQSAREIRFSRMAWPTHEIRRRRRTYSSNSFSSRCHP